MLNMLPQPMRRSCLSRSFPPSLLILVGLFAPGARAGSKPGTSPVQKYTVTSLGVLDNAGSSAVVRQVNANNEIVGGFRDGKKQKASSAFLLSATGFDEIADGEPADFSASYGINDTGQIAGAVNEGDALLPFVSTKHTNFMLLPLLPGDTSGAAYAINAKGESVGFTSGPGGVHATRWTKKGDVQALPGLPGVVSAKALSINAQGDSVGYAGEGTTLPVLWSAKGGGALQLQVLSTYVSSQVDCISDSGDAVGSATAYDMTQVRMRAVLWPAGSTTPMDLGALPGGSTSRARAVSADQTVVGTSDSSIGNHAFVWTSGTGMQDLNGLSTDPSYVLIDAMSVTKQGVILAIGISKSDFPPGDTKDVEEHELPRHILLLTPAK